MVEVNAEAVVAVFDACFAQRENTVLRGGGDEPLYEPATVAGPAVITFRNDYVSSVLHEVAHWCIAGRERRKLVDFGYWYQPDGRDADQQNAFFNVEVRPQAVEWCLHAACGLRFRVSIDNLAGSGDGDVDGFVARVTEQVECMLAGNMPPRAKLLADALAERFGQQQWHAFAPAAANVR